MTHLRAGSLSLDAVPRTRETELVVRNGRALDKVRVFQPLLAQRALERGRVGGGCGRRRVRRWHGGGWHERHRRRAGVHGSAGRAVGTTSAAATASADRDGSVQIASYGTVSGTAAAAAAAAGTVAAGTGTDTAGRAADTGRTAAVGLARCHRCGADVSAAG